MDITADLTTTFNARALTGLPLEGGGTLASRVLYRSDGLAGLDSQGVAKFAHYRIGTVIDLRTDSERSTSADVLPADGSVNLIALPVLGGDMEGMTRSLLTAEGSGTRTEQELEALLAQIPSLEQLYLSMLTGATEQFARLGWAVIEAAEREHPAVLVHCTAGKDRTGVASALLLGVAGVSREAIVADYALTAGNLARGFSERLLAMISGYGVPITPELRTLATESPAPVMETVLDWLAEQFGGPAEYLQSAGMSAGEVQELRRVLHAEPV